MFLRALGAQDGVRYRCFVTMVDMIMGREERAVLCSRHENIHRSLTETLNKKDQQLQIFTIHNTMRLGEGIAISRSYSSSSCYSQKLLQQSA